MLRLQALPERLRKKALEANLKDQILPDLDDSDYMDESMDEDKDNGFIVPDKELKSGRISTLPMVIDART